MNNKGFTTVEVIVSFALVVIIMASMTTMLIAYRDTINIEETKSKMIEFKNTFTFMVYQDIIYDGVKGIQPCSDIEPNSDIGNLCVEFIGTKVNPETGKTVINRLTLEPDVVTIGSEGEEQRRVYLNYNGIRMMLPDSDLNKYIIEKDENNHLVTKEATISQIHDFILKKDELNGVYSLVIPLEHKGIDYLDNIRVVVAN